MPNSFRSAGMSIQNEARESLGIDISLSRVNGPAMDTVGPFKGNSPPIGHELLTQSGLDLSTKPRTFYFLATHTGTLGEPRIGDIVTDHDDDSKWKVLPQGDQYAWHWHGSDQTAYSVITKRDEQ